MNRQQKASVFTGRVDICRIRFPGVSGRQEEATSVGLTTSDCDGVRRQGFLTARAGCKGPLRSWKLGGLPQAAHLIY